jgi:hypothetical protein
MKFDPSPPDAVRQMIAQFGSQIEYTEREPNGLVNLARSEVTNEDLRQLIFYPGFDALVLDETMISSAGLKYIGEMSSLETLRLDDTLISDDGLNSLLGLSKLERLDIGCNPGCCTPGQRPIPAARVRQGQRTLTLFPGKDLHQEGVVPAANAAFHHQALTPRMLLEQRVCEPV